MSIKEKIKSVIDRVRGKDDHAAIDKTVSDAKSASNKHNSELAAEEVVREEVYPDKTHKKTCRRAKTACAEKSTKSTKPARKRSRPTNSDYQMIDPSGESVDSSQS